jgi:hypothetical protein
MLKLDRENNSSHCSNAFPPRRLVVFVLQTLYSVYALSRRQFEGNIRIATAG